MNKVVSSDRNYSIQYLKKTNKTHLRQCFVFLQWNGRMYESSSLGEQGENTGNQVAPLPPS